MTFRLRLRRAARTCPGMILSWASSKRRTPRTETSRPTTSTTAAVRRSSSSAPPPRTWTLTASSWRAHDSGSASAGFSAREEASASSPSFASRGESALLLSLGEHALLLARQLGALRGLEHQRAELVLQGQDAASALVRVRLLRLGILGLALSRRGGSFRLAASLGRRASLLGSLALNELGHRDGVAERVRRRRTLRFLTHRRRPAGRARDRWTKAGTHHDDMRCRPKRRNLTPESEGVSWRGGIPRAPAAGRGPARADRRATCRTSPHTCTSIAGRRVPDRRPAPPSSFLTCAPLLLTPRRWCATWRGRSRRRTSSRTTSTRTASAYTRTMTRAARSRNRARGSPPWTTTPRTSSDGSRLSADPTSWASTSAR